MPARPSTVRPGSPIRAAGCPVARSAGDLALFVPATRPAQYCSSAQPPVWAELREDLVAEVPAQLVENRVFGSRPSRCHTPRPAPGRARRRAGRRRRNWCRGRCSPPEIAVLRRLELVQDCDLLTFGRPFLRLLDDLSSAGPGTGVRPTQCPSPLATGLIVAVPHRSDLPLTVDQAPGLARPASPELTCTGPDTP